MNHLDLFYNIAYAHIDQDSGHDHYFNDAEFFIEFYDLVVGENSDVIDIGFNIGRQTEILLNITNGRCIGIEASKRVYDYALDKFKSNSRVELFNLAVSNFTGAVDFFDTPTFGTGSLYRTPDVNSATPTIKVEVKQLDDILPNENNISLIKLDIEGAEIPAIDGARRLVERNRPYMVMEYCHNAFCVEYRGKRVDKYTLFDFAKEIGYIVYNIYGICLSDPEVYDSSILKDTLDVYLIPEEEHHRWSTELLPIYQYKVLDKILDAFVWRKAIIEPSSTVWLFPRRIYDVINRSDYKVALQHLNFVRDRLLTLGDGRELIRSCKRVSERGRILLLLIYDGKLDDAYQLGKIKNLLPEVLQSFAELTL
jgi:FkbM family methyltransferase